MKFYEGLGFRKDDVGKLISIVGKSQDLKKLQDVLRMENLLPTLYVWGLPQKSSNNFSHPFDITRKLKSNAKELECNVIVFIEMEKDDLRGFNLSFLREEGHIVESDSDLVLFIDQISNEGASLSIRKNRMGECGKFFLDA